MAASALSTKWKTPLGEVHSDNAKKNFARNLLSDTSNKREFNRYAEWTKNEPKHGHGTYGPADGPSDCGNGCNLSNITRNQCADLVYSFPIDAPMRVLFVDIYAADAAFKF